ncbi:MAG: aldo/keto reductase [Alphaproteobacteria bacterium]
MQMRRLGRSNLLVSPLCFGGNVFGWTADEATSFALLDAFVDAGFNFIDTADTYSIWIPGHVGGESETIIGKWLKRTGKRDKVIIATKFGSPMGPDKKGLSPAYMRTAVEDSLRRLQTDYIDLYQSHRDDPGTPIEATLGAYADLVKQGKVRAIGASNFTASRMMESLAVSARNSWPRYESLQPEYNLCERAGYEAELEPLCRAQEIGVIGYYSLASGFLSGKYRSQADLGKSVRGQRGAAKYVNERGFRILAALDQVAARYKSNPTQISLAWLIARPGVTSPIVSATSLAQMQDLIAAPTVKLDADAIATLDRASA